MNLRRFYTSVQRCLGSVFQICLGCLPWCATALIGLTSVVALCGWRFHLPGALPRLLGSPRMAPDTALAFLLSSVTIALLFQPRTRLLNRSCALLFLAGGFCLPWLPQDGLPATLAHQLFGLLGSKAIGTFPHMARAAAAGFSVWGLGLLLLLSRRAFKFRRIATSVCGTLLCSLGAACFLNFILGIRDQDQKTLNAWLFQMSAETGVLFCLLGITLAIAASRYPDMRNRASRPFFQNTTIALVSLAFLLLFVGVNVSLGVGIDESARTKVAVATIYGQAKAIDALVAGLREAESGQRGFLLSGDERYLRSYQHGLERANIALRSGPIAADPATLSRLVKARIFDLRETIRLKQAGGSSSTLLRSTQGLITMEDIERRAASAKAAFYSTIGEQNGAYLRAIQFVRRTIIASYALAVCLLSCAALFFHREIARRTLVEQKLREQEAELATRVEERTAQLGASEARYRALMDQSPLAVHVLDRFGNSQHVNAAFERMVGLSAQQMRGYNIWADPQPARQGTLGVLQTAFAGQSAVTGSIRHVPALSSGTVLGCSAAEPSWVEVIAYPVKNTAGDLQEVVLLCQDVSAREQALLAVRESEMRFRQLADLLPQIVWTAKPDGVLDYFNRRWYVFAEDAPGGPENWPALVHPDDLPLLLTAWADALSAVAPYQLEQRLWDAKCQEYRWHLARAVPIFDDRGQVKRWFGTTTDIHEQKTAEETLERKVRARTSELQHSNFLLRSREEELRLSLDQRDILFREVHHRVKNNLQVISSLLRMQGESLKSEPAASIALEESRRRVLSMALIHERLYANGSADSVDFADYTRTLVRELVYSYSLPGRKINAQIHVDCVELNVHQAIPCGLILNELVTNALKYAFASQTSGEIKVVLRNTAESQVELLVRDNGPGLPEGLDWRHSQSLGLPIVDILARQIEGSVEYAFEQGATFHVRFPRLAKEKR